MFQIIHFDKQRIYILSRVKRIKRANTYIISYIYLLNLTYVDIILSTHQSFRKILTCKKWKKIFLFLYTFEKSRNDFILIFNIKS